MSAKVLVVDDSGLARRTLRHMLEEMGHTVEEVTDGASALERYVVSPPDVILLDMVMHGLDGLATLIKLREMDTQLPVIIATADIQKSTREQVQAAGASAMVNKPVKKDELASVLALVLSGGTAWS